MFCTNSMFGNLEETSIRMRARDTIRNVTRVIACSRTYVNTWKTKVWKRTRAVPFPGNCNQLTKFPSYVSALFQPIVDRLLMLPVGCFVCSKWTRLLRVFYIAYILDTRRERSRLLDIPSGPLSTRRPAISVCGTVLWNWNVDRIGHCTTTMNCHTLLYVVTENTVQSV